MFPIRLKQLRKEKNLTQDDLGNVLGYTRAAISGYELGRNEPSYDVLQKLSEYFEVSIDYLLGKTNVRNKQSFSIDDNAETLYKKIKNLGKDNIVLVEEFANVIENGNLKPEAYKLIIKLLQGYKE